jgi:hypothetical protein
MNLDGHNVKLRLVKAKLYYLDEYSTANAVYEYRYKKINITVKPPFLYDYTTWVPAKLVMRRGLAVRTIKPFVAPQCNAL